MVIKQKNQLRLFEATIDQVHTYIFIHTYIYTYVRNENERRIELDKAIYCINVVVGSFNDPSFPLHLSQHSSISFSCGYLHWVSEWNIFVNEDGWGFGDCELLELER